jgi:hypothetical protein
MNYPKIQVWRMSASRPWQLKKTSQSLFDRLKYSGELNYNLIESVLVEELSDECIEYAKSLFYDIHIIKPAQGQGHAMEYALNRVIDTKYSLKWEDDFMPIIDIPLNDCIALMEEYSHINQICFNKRRTMKYKRMSEWNKETKRCEVFEWEKEQRYYKMGTKQYPLVVKDAWWFGSSLWRTDFIRPLFKAFPNDTHNKMNDLILRPRAGFIYGDEAHGFRGRKQPSAVDMEFHVGSYIWGKVGDPQMVEHTGREDSLWKGDLQKRWRANGFKILGNDNR